MESSKLLKAQSHVWNHLFSFINSISLKCAIDLGIPDIIHKYKKPMPLSQLIASLPHIHPSKASCINRLMKILTHSGFFSTHNIINTQNNELETGYVLTDSSTLLLKDNPFSMVPFLLAALDPIMVNPWQQLSNWFRNKDRAAFETEHGMSLWDCANRNPKFNDMFNDAMASDSRLVASLMIENCKGVFEGLRTFVDVGGGIGVTAKTIAKSFPHLECTVFDLPHVVAGLEDCDNLRYVGGDMFEAIPPSDALLLKWILHDWNDEACIKVLKKCKEAIMSKGKEGKVIIIDTVIDDEKQHHESIETQLFFDLQMMVLVMGKQRNEKEWANLILSAGFHNYNIIPIFGLRSLIEIIYP